MGAEMMKDLTLTYALEFNAPTAFEPLSPFDAAPSASDDMGGGGGGGGMRGVRAGNSNSSGGGGGGGGAVVPHAPPMAAAQQQLQRLHDQLEEQAEAAGGVDLCGPISRSML